MRPDSPGRRVNKPASKARSEEHTSELQSHSDLLSFPTRRSSDLHVEKSGDGFRNCQHPGDLRHRHDVTVADGAERDETKIESVEPIESRACRRSECARIHPGDE